MQASMNNDSRDNALTIPTNARNIIYFLDKNWIANICLGLNNLYVKILHYYEWTYDDLCSNGSSIFKAFTGSERP